MDLDTARSLMPLSAASISFSLAYPLSDFEGL